MMNAGVQTKTIDTEWSKRPIPNKKEKTPVNIGLRDQAYGPSVTSSRGGLNGTGVPFAFENHTTHQAQIINPNDRRTAPISVPIGSESNFGKPSARSMYRLPKTTKSNIPKKTTSPTGVRSNRRCLEPIATKKNRSASLSYILLRHPLV